MVATYDIETLTLEAYELCRFKVAMAVLKWSYTGEKQAPLKLVI